MTISLCLSVVRTLINFHVVVVILNGAQCVMLQSELDIS